LLPQAAPWWHIQYLDHPELQGVRLSPFFMLEKRHQDFEDRTMVSKLSLSEYTSFPTFEENLLLAEK
jgi:hypothetical protein